MSTKAIEIRILNIRGKRRGQYRPQGATTWRRMTVPDAEEALRCMNAGELFWCISEPVRVLAAPRVSA